MMNIMEEMLTGPRREIAIHERLHIECAGEACFLKMVNVAHSDGWKPIEGTYRESLELRDNPDPNPPSYKVVRKVEMGR